MSETVATTTPAATGAHGLPHPAAAAGAAIFDLGYKRYAGPREAQRQRWRVIAKQLVRDGWKGWRYKAVLFAAACIVFGFGLAMYIGRFVSVVPEIQRMLNARLTDASAQWLPQLGFMVGMFAGARAIAADRESGAFTFYFSRSVRPIDYVFGKFAGLFALQALVYAAGVVLLAVVRLVMYDDLATAWSHAALLPKAILLGLVGAAYFAVVPLGLSSLVATRRQALVLWALYYTMIAGVLIGLGEAFGLDLRQLHATKALVDLARGFFVDEAFTATHAEAIAWLVGQIGLFFAIAYARVLASHNTGIGGA